MLTSPVLEMESHQSTAARYESLIRIAASVRAQKKPEDLFRLLIEELGQVIQFDAIAQYDESSSKVHWHMCSGCRKPDSVPSEIHKEGTLAAWVYRNQEAVALPNLDGETRFPASTDLMRRAGLQSICAFPLSTAHRRLGSLVIASVHRDAYSKEEIRFCSLVADQIALAMDDAFNFQASQRAQERLELLLDLTNRVVSNLNLRDVLREISANIRRAMQCDGVGIDLPSPEDKKLRLYALDFPENPGIIEEGFEPPADEKASALRVFISGEPVILSKEEIEEESTLPKVGIQSLAHVPMIGRGGIVGVLSLGSWRELAFSQEDLAFLGQIARQVAIAVENAWAFGEVSDLRNKLAQEKLYLEGEILSELKFEEIVGKSEALRRVLQEVETVAPTDSTVLIYGETGTGKELIARAVHNLSSRQSNGFVKLNCAAIPTGLHPKRNVRPRARSLYRARFRSVLAALSWPTMAPCSRMTKEKCPARAPTRSWLGSARARIAERLDSKPGHLRINARLIATEVESRSTKNAHQRTEISLPICTTASTFSPCGSQRCESVRKIFPCWSSGLTAAIQVSCIQQSNRHHPVGHHENTNQVPMARQHP